MAGVVLVQGGAVCKWGAGVHGTGLGAPPANTMLPLPRSPFWEHIIPSDPVWPHSGSSAVEYVDVCPCVCVCKRQLAV